MRLPNRFLDVAERVKKRRRLRAVRFRTKAPLPAVIPRVTAEYDSAFVKGQGYVPITEAKAIGERIIAIAHPCLVTLLLREDEIIGFLLAYPDLSTTIQRCRGRM